jgi:hypothetical protein
MVKLVVNGCGTVALHRSVEQDQEIPIGVRLRITPGTGPVEDNARGWIESLERIAETVQEDLMSMSDAAMLDTCAFSVCDAQSPVLGPAEYRLLSRASSKPPLARAYLCLNSVRWRAPVSWAFSPHSRSENQASTNRCAVTTTYAALSFAISASWSSYSSNGRQRRSCRMPG